MGRLGLGAGLAIVVFIAGGWAGSAWTQQRVQAAEALERARIATRSAAIRAQEAERLRAETAMDLQLGEVIEHAKDIDPHHVVFDAGRLRGLIPAR